MADNPILKKERSILLLDFYGNLLTPRQQEVFALSFEDDYSFGEIGQALDITPQGVHDLIKRGHAQLEKYEAKLGLIAKFESAKIQLEDIFTQLDNLPHADTATISNVKQSLQQLI